ncbi:MAG TPA: LLM class flavin-dependent oxidoreductase [Stellaceae bacterium]|nr:LLM class flavin-dependent oxidoreductase [Stellaceae bacterium]
MKLLSFHLMPYRHLDFEAAAKHRSAWVVLPNSLYDPVLGADEYQSHIDFLVHSESLGFDGLGVNEHHQTAYGMMPAPNLIASTLIARTKTAKIAILGRALPLTNNPIFIAEEFAMLDNLSRGRIIAGFVRGIGAEYHSSGTNPYFSHERFHEAHDLIVKAWTEPGPFNFDGQHFNNRYVNLWPRPYQKPHLPIWIPSQGSSETVVWASHPDRKYPFLVTFSPGELVTRYLNSYRDQARKYGYEPSGDQLGWATPIYVADTDERAREESKRGLETLFNNYLRMTSEMLIPPGYTSLSSTKAFFKMRQNYATRDSYMTAENLVSGGTAVVGSPKTVRAAIEALREKTGFNILIGMFQFGVLSDELARRSIELFHTDVMPHLKG